MIITGNKEKGLAAELFKIYPDATFCSRANGYDLVTKDGREQFAEEATKHDIIILNSALWQFQQTVLLDTVYRALITTEKTAHIVCVGSTTDRVKNGKAWLYNAEKKALRDYSNTLSISGVWSNTPKVSYISFGTLSNNQAKHPDRKTLTVAEAAQYVKWLTDQPKYVNINELSIDPMQDDQWYD
jgi:short-subunit dehydrogenase